jgi:hypothetical protein
VIRTHKLLLTAAALGETVLEPGAFAFLPARDPQRLSCTMDARCTVYLCWDGSPKSHAVR